MLRTFYLVHFYTVQTFEKRGWSGKDDFPAYKAHKQPRFRIFSAVLLAISIILLVVLLGLVAAYFIRTKLELIETQCGIQSLQVSQIRTCTEYVCSRHVINDLRKGGGSSGGVGSSGGGSTYSSSKKSSCRKVQIDYPCADVTISFSPTGTNRKCSAYETSVRYSELVSKSPDLYFSRSPFQCWKDKSKKSPDYCGGGDRYALPSDYPDWDSLQAAIIAILSVDAALVFTIFMTMYCIRSRNKKNKVIHGELAQVVITKAKAKGVDLTNSVQSLSGKYQVTYEENGTKLQGSSTDFEIDAFHCITGRGSDDDGCFKIHGLCNEAGNVFFWREITSSSCGLQVVNCYAFADRDRSGKIHLEGYYYNENTAVQGSFKMSNTSKHVPELELKPLDTVSQNDPYILQENAPSLAPPFYNMPPPENNPYFGVSPPAENVPHNAPYMPPPTENASYLEIPLPGTVNEESEPSAKPAPAILTL